MTKSVFTDAYRHLMKALIQERKDAKITQQELSDKLGKPQSFVSKYESGERRLDVVELLQITEVLGIDIFPLIREIQAMVKQR